MISSKSSIGEAKPY